MKSLVILTRLLERVRQVDQAFKLLRNPGECDFESIKSVWVKTHYARRKSSKKNVTGVLWQWKDFSCLAQNRDLVKKKSLRFFYSRDKLIIRFTFCEDPIGFREKIQNFVQYRRHLAPVQEFF